MYTWITHYIFFFNYQFIFFRTFTHINCFIFFFFGNCLMTWSRNFTFFLFIITLITRFSKIIRYTFILTNNILLLIMYTWITHYIFFFNYQFIFFRTFTHINCFIFFFFGNCLMTWSRNFTFFLFIITLITRFSKIIRYTFILTNNILLLIMYTWIIHYIFFFSCQFIFFRTFTHINCFIFFFFSNCLMTWSGNFTFFLFNIISVTCFSKIIRYTFILTNNIFLIIMYTWIIHYIFSSVVNLYFSGLLLISIVLYSSFSVIV